MRKQFQEVAKAARAVNKGTEFIVRRDGDADLKFNGWHIAKSSTLDAESTSLRRWKEWNLYLTLGGNWICHKAGLTVVGGEVDRHLAIVVPRDGIDRRSNAEEASRTEHVSAEDLIKEFFGRDALAKDLYEQAGIEDVEEVE